MRRRVGHGLWSWEVMATERNKVLISHDCQEICNLVKCPKAGSIIICTEGIGANGKHCNVAVI